MSFTEEWPDTDSAIWDSSSYAVKSFVHDNPDNNGLHLHDVCGLAANETIVHFYGWDPENHNRIIFTSWTQSWSGEAYYVQNQASGFTSMTLPSADTEHPTTYMFVTRCTNATTYNPTVRRRPAWNPFRCASDGTNIYFAPATALQYPDDSTKCKRSVAAYRISNMSKLWEYTFTALEGKLYTHPSKILTHDGFIYVWIPARTEYAEDAHIYKLSTSGSLVATLTETEFDWDDAEMISANNALVLAGVEAVVQVD